MTNEALNDPKIAEFKMCDTQDIGELVRLYLNVANAEQFNFYSHSDFMTAVIDNSKDIEANGIKVALERYLSMSGAPT